MWCWQFLVVLSCLSVAFAAERHDVMHGCGGTDSGIQLESIPNVACLTDLPVFVVCDDTGCCWEVVGRDPG